MKLVYMLPPVAHTLIHSFGVFKQIFTNTVGSLEMVATAAATTTAANEINTSPSKLAFRRRHTKMKQQQHYALARLMQFTYVRFTNCFVFYIECAHV